MFQRRRPLRSPLSGFNAQELLLAHSHFQLGEYTQAALIYEQMAAKSAALRGFHSPKFYLHAGRSWLFAGQVEIGMMMLAECRRLALEVGNERILTSRLPRLAVELKKLGLEAQAEEISTWLPKDTPICEWPGEQHPVDLPSRCPNCGSPVLPDEVDWIDEKTAACEFCGGPLQGS